MDTHQISLCYLPVTGGQEVYVSQLAAVARKLGRSHVVQAKPHATVSHETHDKESVTFVKVPRGIGRINNLLPTLFFRERSRRLISNISRDSKLIYHYASLCVETKHPAENTIVVSHGRDWDERKLTGRWRAEKLISSYRMGYKVVCNDTDVANYISEKEGLKYKFSITGDRCGNLIYLPNSFDARLFNPDQQGGQVGEYFLVVRNLRKSRGIDLVIKAYAEYINRGGGLDLVVIGGPTVGAYYDKLKKLCLDVGVTDKVNFLGQKHRDEIPEYYRKAALSIVPSIAYEGTSISALESMACGCPCLSTTVGGLADIPTIKFDSVSQLAGLMMRYRDFDRGVIANSVKAFSSTDWEVKWGNILGE